MNDFSNLEEDHEEVRSSIMQLALILIRNLLVVPDVPIHGKSIQVFLATILLVARMFLLLSFPKLDFLICYYQSYRSCWMKTAGGMTGFSF